MRFFTTLFIFFSLSTISIWAQDTPAYEWHNPLESLSKMEGQGWENIAYTRLPKKAEKQVRKAVWNLSRNSAGVSIRFKTNAQQLLITYEVDGNIAMNHMPATGVSGLDLYGKDTTNNWLWYKGKYSFNDTISYHYNTKNSPPEGREYQLFLPLYNTCKNLKIGVPKGHTITFEKPRTEKPIVVYGTSIAQGGCASRPGMAWTSILQRKLDYPIINLGFSGNGRLEMEVLEFIAEIDAKVFVLDCLPNLSPSATNTEKEIKKRLHSNISYLREKRPEATILLTQHAGYSDGLVDDTRKNNYETLNRWTSEVFLTLKKEGDTHLHMLLKEDINLSNDAFVDGTHPTDLGMEQYAQAYARVLATILKKE